jgi:hypothetical protein
LKEITGDASLIPPLEQGHKKSSTDKSEELELYENRRSGFIRKLLRLTYLP